MFLESVVQGIERRAAALGRRFLATDPRTQLREDIRDVGDDLAARRKALTECREDAEALRNRINENQAVVALLVGKIGVAVARGAGDQAYRDALALDRARRQLAEDQARLPRREERAAALELQIRFLTRKLARLQEQLYS